MLNSLARQRLLAASLIKKQVLVACVVALACLVWGPSHALAGFAGGILAAVGTLVLALRSLTRGRSPIVLTRMLFGMALRWLVILGGMALMVFVWRWPPIPVIAGLTATLLVPIFSFGREP